MRTLDNLVVTNSTALTATTRTLARHVAVMALDAQDNRTKFSAGCAVFCWLRRRQQQEQQQHATHAEADGSSPPLPRLVGSSDDGLLQGEISENGSAAIFNLLELIPEVGGGDGHLELVFSYAPLGGSGGPRQLEDARHTSHSSCSCSVGFQFTTDEGRAEEVRAYRERLDPLQEAITNHERRFAEARVGREEAERGIAALIHGTSNAKIR